MLTPEQLHARAASLMDQIEAFAAQHEREDHGGERCDGNRIALAAWIAYHLGVQDAQATFFMSVEISRTIIAHHAQQEPKDDDDEG